jgi:AraC-like DNA-binding protein
MRAAIGDTKFLDIALDCGFGDVSNFNWAFRTEYGVSPRSYRRGIAERRTLCQQAMWPYSGEAKALSIFRGDERCEK